MAQTNYTPIQLYNSTTAAAAPIAANLANGELAINITDGKLYYKDNSGVVQVIATKGAGTIGGSTTQIQYNNAGALAGNAAMTFNSGTSTTTLTTLNLTNALGATYGGTAQSTYTQGDVLYSSAANTLAKLSIGAVNYILASTGSVPQWVAPSSIAVLTATNLAGGLAGSVPYQSALDTTTFLAIGAANRVMTSTGSAPQWVTSLTGLTGVSSTSLTASTTLGVTGVSTLTGGAVVQGLTVGLGAGAVAGNTAVGVSALAGNSTGARLTAVGASAGVLNTASDNSFVGYSAGTTNTSGINNTALGSQALYTNSVGGNNTAIGYTALLLNTGSNNTAVGGGPYPYATLGNNSSGAANTAVGTSALAQNTTASNNTAVGYQAGYTNSTGTPITAVGYQAGYTYNSTDYWGSVFVGWSAGKLTTGTDNTAVGGNSLLTNSSGSYNTAIGAAALRNSTTANYNTAVGYGASQLNETGASNASLGTSALYSNLSGSFNTAIGRDALAYTTASNNTAVGYQAGYSGTTGAENTLLGAYAGYTGTTATRNTFVGQNAGYYTTGSTNTFIGRKSDGNGAGQEVTTGSKNTIIGGYNGNQGGLDIRAASNYIVLSDGDGNPRFYSDGSGHLFAYNAVNGDFIATLKNSGTSAPYGLDVAYDGVATNNTVSYFYRGYDLFAGTTRFEVRSNGGIANYQANDVNLSDRREKTNFAPAKSYLNIICAIPVQTFNYIDQNHEEDPGLTLGVIAQDVQAVAPELVMESNWADKDKEPKMRLSIYQTDLQYALMKCIQEQQALITQLAARITALETA